MWGFTVKKFPNRQGGTYLNMRGFTHLILVAKLILFKTRGVDYVHHIGLFPLDLKIFRRACAIPGLFWFHPFGLETKNISTQDKIVWHNFKSRIIMPNIDYAPSFFWSKSIFWHWTRAVWTWAKKQNSVQSNLALKIC